MNPRTSVFNGFGVYTRARGVDNPDIRRSGTRGGTFIRDTVISPSPHMNVFRGMGADPTTCQPGYMPLYGFCVPTVSMPSSGCQPGTVEPWPGAGFCLPTMLPSGTAPGAELLPLPWIPGPCPAGMFGLPPYCFLYGTPLPPGGQPPSGTPVPIPVPPQPPAPAPAPDATKDDWVVPVIVGVGVIALVGIAVASRRKATPNRRRRRRR